MNFILNAYDKQNHLHIRQENRPAHVEFLKNSDIHNVKVLLAGPKLDDNGEMCGSVLILESNSKADVEKFANADPYAKAELFEKVEISALNIAINGF